MANSEQWPQDWLGSGHQCPFPFVPALLVSSAHRRCLPGVLLLWLEGKGFALRQSQDPGPPSYTGPVGTETENRGWAVRSGLLAAKDRPLQQ